MSASCVRHAAPEIGTYDTGHPPEQARFLDSSTSSTMGDRSSPQTPSGDSSGKHREPSSILAGPPIPAEPGTSPMDRELARFEAAAAAFGEVARASGVRPPDRSTETPTAVIIDLGQRDGRAPSTNAQARSTPQKTHSDFRNEMTTSSHANERTSRPVATLRPESTGNAIPARESGSPAAPRFHLRAGAFLLVATALAAFVTPFVKKASQANPPSASITQLPPTSASTAAIGMHEEAPTPSPARDPSAPTNTLPRGRDLIPATAEPKTPRQAKPRLERTAAKSQDIAAAIAAAQARADGFLAAGAAPAKAPDDADRNK